MLIETTAVSALARSPSGVRDVSTAKNGPLMSGVNSVATKRATSTSGQGGRNGRAQIGSANPRIATPARRSGGILRTASTATMLPTTAPAPIAA